MPIHSRYANAKVDLKTLVERYAPRFSPTREQNDHHLFGPEYVGACPFCMLGNNRFHVWPVGGPYYYEGEWIIRPHYWCRQCGAEGSPAQFLQTYVKMSFGEALAEMGLTDKDVPLFKRKPRPIDPGSPPNSLWQDTMKGIVKHAEYRLWTPDPSYAPAAKAALAYLHHRGFTDETLKKFHIGYVPALPNGKWFAFPYTHVGVDPETIPEDKREGGVYLPPGIVIPWFEGEDILWKIMIRRSNSSDHHYHEVKYSSEGLFNVNALASDLPIGLFESEFDVMAAEQESGKLIAPIATGGTQKGQKPHWLALLASSNAPVIQMFDADEGGDTGAKSWAKALKGQVVRWRPWADEDADPVRFKDANDMLQKKQQFAEHTGGHTLQDWVRMGVETAQATMDKRAKKQARQDAQKETSTEAQPLARGEEMEEWILNDGGEFELETPVQNSPTTPVETSESRDAQSFISTPEQPPVHMYGAQEVVQASAPLPEPSSECWCGALVYRYCNAGIAYCEEHWPWPDDTLLWVEGTCVQCGKATQHVSPNGQRYCDAHYQCVRGHAVRWRYDVEQGLWLCACYWEIEQEIVSSDFTAEETALAELLAHVPVKLSFESCPTCKCRLQYRCLGTWECAACIPHNGWSDDLCARIRASRTAQEPPTENYWTRLRAKLKDFKAEVPARFLELANRPRVYAAPFPAYALISQDGKQSLQVIGTWDPSPGGGIIGVVDSMPGGSK